MAADVQVVARAERFDATRGVARASSHAEHPAGLAANRLRAGLAAAVALVIAG